MRGDGAAKMGAAWQGPVWHGALLTVSCHIPPHPVTREGDDEFDDEFDGWKG